MSSQHVKEAQSLILRAKLSWGQDTSYSQQKSKDSIGMMVLYPLFPR